MIKIKQSDNGFSLSYSTRDATVEEARRELTCARKKIKGVKVSIKVTGGRRVKVTRWPIWRGPILIWVFEGEKREIAQLIAAQ